LKSDFFGNTSPPKGKQSIYISCLRFFLFGVNKMDFGDGDWWKIFKIKFNYRGGPLVDVPQN
jgi:hypothetical protein